MTSSERGRPVWPPEAQQFPVIFGLADVLCALGFGNEPVQQFQKTVFVIGFPRQGPGKAVILQQCALVERDALPPALRVIRSSEAAVKQGDIRRAVREVKGDLAALDPQGRHVAGSLLLPQIAADLVKAVPGLFRKDVGPEQAGKLGFAAGAAAAAGQVGQKFGGLAIAQAAGFAPAEEAEAAEALQGKGSSKKGEPVAGAARLAGRRMRLSSARHPRRVSPGRRSSFVSRAGERRRQPSSRKTR